VKEKGVLGLYRGMSALVIGNSMKAGVRFLAFEQFKVLLGGKDKKLDGPRMVIAGLGAGVCEAVLVVTPSETIKVHVINTRLN
jgi:solute carrier family 25 (mitochondrial citrate transporter), member 1